jgi:hypothetical protein
MKTIPLDNEPRGLFELWDKVGRDYIVFTRNGKPVAYLLSADGYDEEDIGYMLDREFWEMIRQRRQGNGGIPLEQIEAEIAEREKADASASKNAARASRNGKNKTKGKN